MFAQQHAQDQTHAADDVNERDVAAPFARFVRVPGVEHHDDGRQCVRCREQKAILHGAEISRLQTFREKRHAAIGRRVVEKINDNHHQDFGSREALPQRNLFGRLQLRGFAIQRCFQIFLLTRGNPFGFARMVADEKPPDGQPDKRQRTFKNQHGLPAIRAEQPAGERRGGGDGERLAEIPKGVGARAFRARKPVREQDDGGGKNAAFGGTQQEPCEFKLMKCFREAATHGARAPKNQTQADEFARAPFPGEIAAKHLQQDVAEEKNSCGLAFHAVVHLQVAHEGRNFWIQGERDVRAIHIRNRIHDQRDGNDAKPPLWEHGLNAIAFSFFVSIAAYEFLCPSNEVDFALNFLKP